VIIVAAARATNAAREAAAPTARTQGRLGEVGGNTAPKGTSPRRRQTRFSADARRRLPVDSGIQQRGPCLGACKHRHHFVTIAELSSFDGGLVKRPFELRAGSALVFGCALLVACTANNGGSSRTGNGGSEGNAGATASGTGGASGGGGSISTAGSAGGGTSSAGAGGAGAAVKRAIDPTAHSESHSQSDRQPVTINEAATASTTMEVGLEKVGTSSEIDRIKTALEKKRKMFLVTALEGARLARIEDNELYIEFSPDAKHLRDTLAKSENVKVVREACLEVTGKEMGVRIAVRENEANDSLPLSKEEEERREKNRLREVAGQNPLVQQVLRTFRGEIIDVQRMSET